MRATAHIIGRGERVREEDGGQRGGRVKDVKTGEYSIDDI